MLPAALNTPPPTPIAGGATGAILWVGVLIVACLGMGVAILLFRRRLLSNEGDDGSAGVLESLRRMRDAGEMSAAEFDAARRSVVSRMSRVERTKEVPPARASGRASR